VAEGKITLSGANSSLASYSDGLLLVSNSHGEPIVLAGQTHALEGAVCAPRGQVEIQATDLAVTGSLIGESGRLAVGSDGATIACENCLPQKICLAW